MPHSADRYKAFAEAYLMPGSDTFNNITQSAVAAGYSWKYANQGEVLLGTKGMKKALEKKSKALLKAADKNGKIVDPELMLEILSTLLLFNPHGLINTRGGFIPLKKVDEETAFCLTSMEYDAQGRIKYKWNDKVSIIKTIFDSLGLKNGNKELVDRVVNKIFNMNVQVNVGVDPAAANEALRSLVDGASGATRGLPGD